MGHGLPVLARLTDGLMVNPNLDLGSREHRLPSAWQVGFHESLFDEILRYHQRYPRRVPRWPGDNTVNVKFHLRFTKHGYRVQMSPPTARARPTPCAENRT